MNGIGRVKAAGVPVIRRKKILGIDMQYLDAPETCSGVGKGDDLMRCHADQNRTKPGAGRNRATLNRRGPVIQPETSWQVMIDPAGDHATGRDKGAPGLRLGDDPCIGQFGPEIGRQMRILGRPADFPPPPLILQLPEIGFGQCSADRAQLLDMLIVIE